MADPMPGAIVHAEYSSNDVAATRKFLEGVFGWEFTKMEVPGPDYYTFKAAGGVGGGLGEPMDTATGPGTLNYVLVKSVAEAEKKIAAHGGKILVPRQEIPKVGFFAVYEAPGGVVQAVFESSRPPSPSP